MKTHLSEDGPLCASVDASSAIFQNYASGVMDSSECGTRLNHSVVIVGWGQASTDYWIVRNSWGSQWGEQGYIKIAIQDGNGVCGI